MSQERLVANMFRNQILSSGVFWPYWAYSFIASKSDKDSCYLKDALGFNFNKLWYPVMKTGHELFFVSTRRNLHPEMLKSISRTESVSPGAKGRDHV